MEGTTTLSCPALGGIRCVRRETTLLAGVRKAIRPRSFKREEEKKRKEKKREGRRSRRRTGEGSRRDFDAKAFVDD